VAAAFRLEEVSDTLLYYAYGPVGAADTDPVWRIYQLEKVGTELKLKFAAGKNGFNYKWSDRATLTYI
jgi:hypothetical protein